MTHRIFIVEDHPITREGLRSLIRSAPDLEVVGEASSGPDAIDLIGSAKPDLVLADIAIDGSDGIELTKQLRSIHPDLKILVVSAYPERVYAERAVRAGALGYVAKQEASGVLLDAIRTVLDGRLHLSDEIRDRVVGSYLAANAPSDSSVSELTDRELEVFRYFGQGLTTAQVADAMMLSPKTVETHRVHIKQKLGLSTTNEFVQRATLWTAQNEA